MGQAIRLTGREAHRGEVGQGPFHVPTVAAIACVAYGASLLLHEGGHAFTGWLVGGRPSLISTTDVRGDWSGVSVVGISAIGISGSLVNWILAGCAVWWNRREHLAPATRWMSWLLLAINGFIPAFYMIVSPLLGFGDWNTVLRTWPGSLVWRGVVAAAGVALTWWWTRVAAGRLVAFQGVGPGDGGLKRLVLASWATGGALAVAAALWSPLGLGWAVAVGTGSTLGTTWPLLPVADLAAGRAGLGGPARVGGLPAHRGWLVAGIAVATVFVGVFGRGVALHGTTQAGASEDRASAPDAKGADWTPVATEGETGCALGTPYRFFHRDGADGKRLLLYFQGGGACWDWVSCSGLFDATVEDDEVSGFRGIFDRTNPENPFRAYEMVFIPYCTGDVHIGDASRRYGDDASARSIDHRGYRNVHAVLEWVSGMKRRPRVVVVAGTSAGSYGALFHVLEVARRFPEARIVLLGDSGVPLLSENQRVVRAWGADDVLRRLWRGESVPDPASSPLLAAYRVAAGLGSRVRLAEITSDQDAVQGAFYLVSGSPRWREATYELLGEVRKAVPSFRTFIVAGSDHGLLPTDRFYDYKAHGVSLKDWVGRLVRGEPVEDARCAGCKLE